MTQARSWTPTRGMTRALPGDEEREKIKASLRKMMDADDRWKSLSMKFVFCPIGHCGGFIPHPVVRVS